MKFKNWLQNEEVVMPFPGSTIQHLVYHGTNKNPFNQFGYQKSQRFVLFASFDVETRGFFFSESPYDAAEFGNNVVACYIDLKNPLLDPRRDKYLAVDRLSKKQEIDLQKILAPMIEKDVHGYFIDIGVGRHYIQNRHRNFGMEWIYDAVEAEGLAWDVLDQPNVVERMIKLGYDGTYVAEKDTYMGRSIFIPSPNQVKMVKWVKGVQDSWGEKEDYYTKKKDGLSQFHGPKI